MINKIREMSWVQYEKRIAENPTVIIPTGACEVYGPHMPMGTDLIAASAIAELVAEKTGALIAPTIEIGESSALTSFPATFTLTRKTLETFLDELFQKLVNDGIKNFLFITGHAGNVDTVSYLIKVYMHKYDIKCAQIDWWRFTNANSGDIFTHKGYMAHGHASECGTSVMLYLRPELVDRDAITSIDPGPDQSGFSDIIQYQKFNKKTPNGMIGDANAADAQKGRQIVEICVNRIADYMKSAF